MDERTQLEQAIKLQESLRGIVDDSIIDTAVSALRRQLAGLQSSHPAQAERKQVSILFADVSGYTALSAGMDAEDVNELMNALWQRLDAIIAGQGGYIDKHMGDSLMAVWGAQKTHENDAERAILAALAMQQEFASHQPALPGFSTRQSNRLPSTKNISLRVGIHTGPVLMGSLGTTGEYTAVGDTVNTAKHIQSIAPPGGVLISHDTFGHVRGVFDVHVLDPILVKGKTEPLQVYKVKRAKPRAFRLHTRGVQGIETHMIGRQIEMDILKAAVQRMAEKKGGLVLVTGEAGVGKSRLLYEFENWMDLQPVQIRFYQGRARQETQGQPYAPLRDLLSLRFGIQENDAQETVWRKMEQGMAEAMLAPNPQQAEIQAHFVGQLLGYDFSSSPHLQGALNDVKQLRDRALIYLEAHFKDLAARLPVVVVLEDIHWADDSSLEAIEQLGRQAANQCLLIVCLARPMLFERRPQCAEPQPYLMRVNLQPLSTPESRQLVTEILRKAEHIPDALSELVVGGAEGNPFFIEELIKLMIEDGVIRTGLERWQVEPERLAQVRIPQTLTALLQARLDSLSKDERTVIQQAAVVGRTFWDQAILSIESPGPGDTPVDEASRQAELAATLESLCRKELIFKQASSMFAGANEYSFQHALLHNVTYESVLKRARRQYHSRVANWLMTRRPACCIGQPVPAAEGASQPAQQAGRVFAGLVADHMELAGRMIEAIAYLDQAGEEAARRYANPEAIAYFNRALALLPGQDLPGQDLPARYELLIQRQNAYNLVGNSTACQADLDMLRAIADELGDVRRQAQVALRQMKFNNRGDLPAAVKLAPTALALARSAKDVECETEVLFAWGWTLCQQGHLDAAQPHIEHALVLAQQAGLTQLEASCLRTMGILCNQRGDKQQMFEYYERALEKHRQAGDRRGEFSALNNLGVNFSDGERRITYLEKALEIAQAIGERFYQGVALTNLSTQDWARGNFSRAIERVHQSAQLYQDIQATVLRATSMTTSAEYAYSMGDYEAAAEMNNQALKTAQQYGLDISEVDALAQQVSLDAILGQQEALRQTCAQLLAAGEKSEHMHSKTLAHCSLSWAHNKQGEHSQALYHSAQAVKLLEQQPDVLLLSRSWKEHGHALANAGSLAEARAAYQKALEARLPWHDQPFDHLLRGCEGCAGLANLALQTGDLPEAQAQVEQILEMGKRPLPGYAEALPGSFCPGYLFDLSDESARIYLVCYQVFKRLGDARAEGLLEDARALLEQRAAKLSTPERRQAYLHSLPEHRQLLA